MGGSAVPLEVHTVSSERVGKDCPGAPLGVFYGASQERSGERGCTCSLRKLGHFFGATAPVLLSGGPVRSSVLSASLSEKESSHSFIAASFRALLPLLNLLALQSPAIALTATFKSSPFSCLIHSVAAGILARPHFSAMP